MTSNNLYEQITNWLKENKPELFEKFKDNIDFIDGNKSIN